MPIDVGLLISSVKATYEIAKGASAGVQGWAPPTIMNFKALRRFMWVDFNPRVLFQPYLARLFCIQGSLKT